MSQIQTFYKKNLLLKIRTGVVVLLGGVFFFLFSFFLNENSFNPLYFSANIFTSSLSQPQENSSDFVIPHYSVEKGEVGEIEIKAQKNLGNIAGFSFTLVFPEEYLSANDINISGTVLENNEFFVQKNISESGKISVVGATGGSGVSLVKGDILLKINFLVKDSTQIGSQLKIFAEKFSTISSELEEKKATLLEGILQLSKNSDDVLKVTGITGDETGMLEINFSSEVSEAKISDFSFLPNSVKNDESEVEIIGKKVVLKNLSLQPHVRYTVFISSSIKSNSGKSLLEGDASSFDFFAKNNVNSLYINKVEIKNPQSVKMFFSNPIPKDKEITKDDIIAENPLVKILNISLDISRKFLWMETDPDTDLTEIFPKPSFHLSDSFLESLQDELVDYEFAIETAESISSSHFTITFTKEPIDKDLLVLSGELKNEEGEKISIEYLEKDPINKKVIHFYTSAQKEEEIHRYLLIPQKWHTHSNKTLGGKNSISFVTKKSDKMEFFRVEPPRFTKGEISELHILGRNFEQGVSVKTQDETFIVQSVSPNGEEIIVKIPENISSGAKNITVTQGIQMQTKKDVLLVDDVIKKISVDSSKSYSSPKKVKNDGVSKFSLYALVSNPDGLSNIDKVTVDLREFEGIAEQKMIPGEIVNGKQFFYISDLTIPETVATKNVPYKIPVTAKNKLGGVGIGEISVFVTKDVKTSVPPEIRNFTVSQTIVVPKNEKNPLLFLAEISDADGNDDISKVAINLSQIGLGVEFMDAKNSGDEESKTWFFEKNGIVIPETVKDGTYDVTMAVIDKTGEESRKTLSLRVSRNIDIPQISTEESYISPSNELLKSSAFKINIKVKDSSGADDIDSVVANLSALGLEPLSLTAGASEGKAKWFSSPDLHLPENISFGEKFLTITASDSSGNTDTQKIPVKIVEKTSHGFAPKVITNKGYSTPANALPDSKTPIDVYVFVEDKDKDISHVILQLGNYAKFVGETLPTETLSNGKTCLSTRTLLCLKPILKEAEGQWFYINNIVVPVGVKSSSEPYNLNVIAVDRTGKIGKGIFPLYVGDSVSMQTREKPYFRFAIPLSPNKVQMVLSSPLNPENIKAEYFSISSAENLNDILKITSVSVSPDGKMVTLKTENQVPRKPYFVKLNTEKLGLRSEKQSDKVVDFSGFVIPSRIKNIKVSEVKSTSPNTFTIKFNQNMNALSAREKSNIQIFELGKKDQLDIESLSFLTPNLLEIRTSEQTPGKSYEIYFKNFESTTGEKIETTQRKVTDGFKLSLAESLASLHHRADFNGDKKVDFKDFTMFASVYGKTYKQSSQAGDLNNDGVVDFADFTLMSSRYGLSEPVDSKETVFLDPGKNEEGEVFEH